GSSPSAYGTALGRSDTGDWRADASSGAGAGGAAGLFLPSGGSTAAARCELELDAPVQSVHAPRTMSAAARLWMRRAVFVQPMRSVTRRITDDFDARALKAIKRVIGHAPEIHCAADEEMEHPNRISPFDLHSRQADGVHPSTNGSVHRVEGDSES